MLKTRKVKAGDKKRAFEIVKNIWEGSDYIPLVFDQWVKDKHGEFAAAVDEKGHLIGFEKLTMLTPNNAWIEGLRKDLKSDVKGVGRFLTEHLFSILSKKKNIRSIRFATYFNNIESITLFGKIGFSVIEKRDHKSLSLSVLKDIPQYKNNRSMQTDDVKLVFDYVNKSRWKRKNDKGMCYSWVVKPYESSLIENDYIKKGNAISIQEGGQIRALCLYTIREKEDLFISFFEADTPKLFHELLQKIKKTAYEQGQKNLCVVLGAKDKISHDLFKKYRFKSWESEGDFLLFDYPAKMLKKI